MVDCMRTYNFSAYLNNKFQYPSHYFANFPPQLLKSLSFTFHPRPLSTTVSPCCVFFSFLYCSINQVRETLKNFYVNAILYVFCALKLFPFPLTHSTITLPPLSIFYCSVLFCLEGMENF